MKFTRLIAFILVAATLMLSLTGCASAYKNPDKYISVPTLKDIKLKQTDIDEKVAEAIDGKTIVKEIVVPNKIVNIVVR